MPTKAAKTYKLKFISKGIVPKKVRKVKVKAYINERYVKVSWAKASDVAATKYTLMTTIPDISKTIKQQVQSYI